MIYYRYLRAAVLTIMLFGTALLFAQQATEEELNELLARGEAAVEAMLLDDTSFLAPRTTRKATDALAEAKSLQERGSDRRLIRIQLRSVLDNVDAAREQARTTSKLLGSALIARQTAMEAGADLEAPQSWQEAEDRLFAAIRDAESGRGSEAAQESDEIAGQYRAVKRDGLRKEILSTARDLISQVEAKRGERQTPTLLLRAQQAMTRAEAALAAENPDSARVHGQEAEGHARQALAMIDYIDAKQGERQAWESALLPYEDLLRDIAAELGGSVSFVSGGTKTLAQFQRVIKEHDRKLQRERDSLQTALAETQNSLETMLTESQTSLASSQSKIAELEKRIKDLEGARSAAQDELARKQETARRVTIAQTEFQPDEAVVLQDELGNVIIRVIGIQFASGRSSLDNSQKRLLGKVAKAIDHFPGAKITVEGHTDSEGGEENNQKISERRADAVAMELAEQLHVGASELSVIGYGEAHPIATNSTKDGRAQNRRIDVLLTIP